MNLRVGLCLAGLCASSLLGGDASISAHSTAGMKLSNAPPTMLWAWEEPEDLRILDPQRVGVAFLAERIFLGSAARVSLRRQHLLVPDGVYAVAVARIEAMPDFHDSSALRKESAEAILRMAALPGIRGIQVDFDATASQREFYTDLLRQVRARLPSGTGLTMTALVSWCSTEDGWLAHLPVDAAGPMFFRLGKHVGLWQVKEPVCKGSAGVSIDEPKRIDEFRSAAPELRSGTRIYLFAPRPWTVGQLSVLNREGVPSLWRGGE